MGLARLVVDLGSVRANYRFLADAAPGLGAVVKANGYGLGAAHVMSALCDEGCTDFFVATPEEGVQLRAVDSAVRIYVFSGPHDDESAGAMARNDLIPVLNDTAQIERWRPYRSMPAAVHIDTGMNRLGFPARTFMPEPFRGMNIRLVMSHLANADDPAHPANVRQIECFQAAAKALPGVPTSLGGSGGILLGAPSDLARAGIALYGGNPFSVRWNPMHAAAVLEAKIIALRDLSDGEAVGYGGAYTTDGDMRVAVLGIGYADGVPRRLRGAEVAYRGTRLPVIGRVSMDLMHIDVTAIASRVALGDWVEVFGRTVRVEETAAWADTISYEVLAGIGNRVPRCHVGDTAL